MPWHQAPTSSPATSPGLHFEFCFMSVYPLDFAMGWALCLKRVSEWVAFCIISLDFRHLLLENLSPLNSALFYKTPSLPLCHFNSILQHKPEPNPFLLSKPHNSVPVLLPALPCLYSISLQAIYRIVWSRRKQMKWILLTLRLKPKRFEDPIMGERSILKADESQQWPGSNSG